MTLTGKQKRHLRGLAMTRRPVFQIGKDGITPALAQSLNDYLVKNELMKVSILDTCPLTLDEAAAEMTGLPAALVQIIGKNIVLYRRNPQLTNGIELPQ